MEKIINSMSLIFSNPVEIIVLFLLMSYASYTDIKEYKIYNKFNLFMFLLRIGFMTYMVIANQYGLNDILNYLLGAFVLALFFLIPAMINNDSIGGDIKFAFNLGLWTGIIPAMVIALMASILNIIYRVAFVNKKDKTLHSQKILNRGHVFISAKERLPLAPFFQFSYVILLIINLLK